MRRLVLVSLFAIGGLLILIGAAVIVASIMTMAPVDIIVYAAGAGAAVIASGVAVSVLGVRLVRRRGA